MIDFLNDIGPLERKVSKDMTSEKVYESLLDEEEQKRQQLEQARQRKRRRMPMMESQNPTEGEEQIEAMTVERTTNFSQAVRETKENGLCLSDKELFDLVLALKENKTTASEYLSHRIQHNEMNDNDRNENIKLLDNIKLYNEVPILMQDTDKSLVGVARPNIENLKLANVRMAPKDVTLRYKNE